MTDQTVKDNIKTCPECGQPLGAGRTDRKFCNEFCRIAYHNSKRKEIVLNEHEMANEENIEFRKVFDVLIKNREILMMHYLYQGESAPLRDLLGRGFNLKFFTSEYTDPDLGLFKFCFDFGYCVYKTDLVYIIERSEEIFLPHN